MNSCPSRNQSAAGFFSSLLELSNEDHCERSSGTWARNRLLANSFESPWEGGFLLTARFDAYNKSWKIAHVLYVI